MLSMLLFFMCMPSTFLYSRNLVEKIIFNNNTIIVVPDKQFKKKYLKEDFFLEYASADVDIHKLNPSTLIMPFLMNVVPVIWLSGETWEIDEIDKNLFTSLGLIKKIFTVLYPEASWNGTLKCRKVVNNHIEPRSKAFAMPFSGGLDSIFTSISHNDHPQLLITIREHSGFIKDAQWDNVTNYIRDFAAAFGHENIFINSNYQRFLNGKKLRELFSKTKGFGPDTSHGLGFLGIVAPILMSKGYTNLKIAAGYTPSYPYPKALCPMVDDNLTFANIIVQHDGFEYSRVDKAEIINNFFKDNHYKPYMYVCQYNSEGQNCCKCEKCIRTIADFLVIGQNDIAQYGFNIELHKVKKLIFNQALSWSKNQYWRLSAIQAKATERIDRGEKIDSFLQSLLDIKCTQVTSTENKFDWIEFAATVEGLKTREFHVTAT